MLYAPVTVSGRPAFGFRTIGSFVIAASSSTTGISSLGPSEQFTPIASTPSPPMVRASAETLHPVKVRLFSSKVIVVIIGSSEFSLAAITAAFSSSRSVMVSKTIRSAPLPALMISEKIS